MRYLVKIILITSFCLMISLNVYANDKENKMNCSAKHLDTNKEVEVKVISGISSKKIATAQWPLGYPTIVIDNSAYLKLPTDTRRFIYYHECAHLKYKSMNEFETDCKSLDLINKKHGLTEIETRKLVKNLVKEFGMSRRWSELLQCNKS
jgi:hypothetical protein